MGALAAPLALAIGLLRTAARAHASLPPGQNQLSTITLARRARRVPRIPLSLACCYCYSYYSRLATAARRRALRTAPELYAVPVPAAACCALLLLLLPPQSA